jgi:hypothetical protein
MADEQHGRTPDIARPGSYCNQRPVPGEYVGAGCGQCGHALVLHIGVTHCPVCELVDLNERTSATIRQSVDAALRRTRITDVLPRRT